MKKIYIITVFILGITSINSQSLINNEDSLFKVNAQAEVGFISILYHTLQNGEDSTNFNYRDQGGQDILFPYTRFQVGLTYKKNIIHLLYQPLEVVTNVTFKEDVKVDTTTFSSGTPMELTYSFPFWRFTYLYNLSGSSDTTLAVGGSLQLRNASIKFKEIGGNNQTVSQNLGPVPALSFLFEKQFNTGLTLTYDLTGSYASSSFINGASYDFEGSLLDTSVKLGFQLKNSMVWFIGCRLLGGSATGNSENINGTWTESSSPYTDNKLATFTVMTGVKLY